MRLSLPLLCLPCFLSGQSLTVESLAPLPEPITNNAVVATEVAGAQYVYSFTGLDSTKGCDGDHLRAYRYAVADDIWEALPDVPDPQGGKIAAAASVIRDRIYVVGGYHLGPSCNEISSDRLHIFDPAANTWLPDGAPLPIPIDDQVQGVWRDSLLYVITGWSNTTNVSAVQVYDPATDAWQAATSVPNFTRYKVFGGSGVIIGDTIYYAGGAYTAPDFPLRAVYRKGIIDPADPLSITWSDVDAPPALLYRSGATAWRGRPLWLGGSAVSYNFDGIAYDGSGGVSPLPNVVLGNPGSDALVEIPGVLPPVMDLRGVAALGDDTYILVGGMGPNQAVLDHTTRLRIDDLTARPAAPAPPRWSVYPNPSDGTLRFDRTLSGELILYDTAGKRVRSYILRGARTLRVSDLPAGVYFVGLREGAVCHSLWQLLLLP